MPSADTFDVNPIHDFVWKYLSKSKMSVDPFARNKRWATLTNDINPNTQAEYHLEADVFLSEMAQKAIKADLILFDPPYSPRQLKECYNSFGRKMQLEDGQTARLRKIWKTSMIPILAVDATVISFGWNTVGMGRSFGFEIIEIMLVCHGADHNDTICMAEKRIEAEALPLFDEVMSL